MNLIKFISIAILLLLTSSVFSQGNSDLASIKWESGTKEKLRSNKINVLGEVGGSIYVLKLEDEAYQPSKFIINKYDSDLNLTNSSEIALKKGKKKSPYLGSLLMNGKIYVFSSIVEKNGSGRGKVHYYQTVDLESLKLNDDAKEIFTLKQKGLVGQILSNFEFKTSSDKSKILFTYDILNNNSSRTSYKCNVYDNTFKKLYSKKVTLTDQIGDPQIFPDNNGNLYAVSLDFVGKHKYKRRGEPSYNFLISKYSDLGEKVDKIPINIEGKDILDMKVSVNKNGDLICGGVFSSTKSFNADGVFLLTLDAETNEIKSQSLEDFKSDFISNSARVNSGRAINNKDGGPDKYLFRYVFQDLHYFEDGSMIFIAEQYTDLAAGDTPVFLYGDLIIVKSSNTGEIEWMNKIPKYQDCYFQDLDFGSYIAQKVNNKLAIIFNDHKDNFGKPIEEAFNAARNNKSVLQTIDLDGNFDRTSLTNIDDLGAVLMPESVIRVDEKESLIFAKTRQNKNQKLGKVMFK